MQIQPKIRLLALKSQLSIRHIPLPSRFKRLVTLIKRDGVILPIVIDEGWVIDGETMHAARAAGIAYVWTADISGLSKGRKKFVRSRLARDGWGAQAVKIGLKTKLPPTSDLIATSRLVNGLRARIGENNQ
jgi:hypothetical protein